MTAEFPSSCRLERATAVQDIADDRYPQTVERAATVANRQGIEQPLRGCSCMPYARVDDRNIQPAGNENRPRRKSCGASRCSLFHGIECPYGIEQRFAFLRLELSACRFMVSAPGEQRRWRS